MLLLTAVFVLPYSYTPITSPNHTTDSNEIFEGSAKFNKMIEIKMTLLRFKTPSTTIKQKA